MSQISVIKPKRPQYLAMLIPYVAVGIGVYGFHNAWSALLSYHIGIVAVLCFVGSRRNIGKGLGTGWWYAAALLFALGGVVLYAFWPLLFKSDILRHQLGNFGLIQTAWPYFAVYFCAANPLLEELFWRGFLGSHSTTPSIGDLFFAGYHVMVLYVFIPPVWLVPVFVICTLGSWMWRMLRRLSGSIVPCIATHIVADLGIIVAVSLKLFS